MDYKEKKYEQAFLRAKKLKETCDSNAVVGWMEYIFPELAESDNERIRKLLVEAVIQVLQDQYCSNRGVSKEKVVAWLEKQDQVKDSAISQHENKTCKKCDNSLTSEDIRSGLIQYFSTFTLDTFAGLDPKKILAWLEAQGEHAKFRNKIQVGDKVTRNQDGVLVNLSQLKRVAKRDTQILANSAKTCKDEQNPAWSEEDEKMLNDILMCGEHHCYLDAGNIDWLKSIKDRVQSQNSSVTDEELAQAKKEAYNEALDKIEYNSGEPTFDDGWSAAIWYLKKRNGKPQNRWKPSDEQMDMLAKVCSTLHLTSGENEIMQSLYDELMKLK